MPIVGRDPDKVTVTFCDMLDWTKENIKSNSVYYTWDSKISDPLIPKADILFEIAGALTDLARGDSVIFSHDWREAPECRFIYEMGSRYDVTMRELKAFADHHRTEDG
jgi:hypothetical protein